MQTAIEKIHGVDVAAFIRGYKTALLWYSHDESDPETGGEPMDSNYDLDDFTERANDRCEADCRAFLYSIGYLITDANYSGSRPDGAPLDDYAGHDFWLTRCGHGAGFWDGDWQGENESAGDQLTKAANAFGNIDPYIVASEDDDGEENAGRVALN